MLAAGATLALIVVGSIVGIRWWKARAAHSEHGAVSNDARERVKAITVVAPAPLPTALPLVGAEGRDADGYPTQYVDRTAFRSLLWHEKFEDLTRYLERLQADFEAEPTREDWPIDAADSFASAEPDLAARLDAWAKATPESFAPYLARAAYFRAVAYARRGSKWFNDTPEQDFAWMRDAKDRGLADVKRALAINPKLVAARRLQIQLLLLESPRAAIKDAIDAALATCPSCFQVRVNYQFSLTPRWGGSYEEMDAFARAAADPSRPRMRLLAGYKDHDRARLLRAEKKLDDARAAIERACALGEHWEFLLERAKIDIARGDLEHALADQERAAALRPGHPDVLADRAWTHHKLKHWEAAGRDLLAVLRIDPTHRTARALYKPVIDGVIYAAWQAHTAGHREDALRLIDLAAELAPTDANVQWRRAAIVTGKKDPGQGDDIEALEKAVRDRPDSFRAVQQLDYALARRRQFDRIVTLWTDYLGRHPSDGRAYMERSGTYLHLRKLKEAAADAAKACELGVSEGCARQKEVERMLGGR